MRLVSVRRARRASVIVLSLLAGGVDAGCGRVLPRLSEGGAPTEAPGGGRIQSPDGMAGTPSGGADDLGGAPGVSSGGTDLVDRSSGGSAGAAGEGGTGPAEEHSVCTTDTPAVADGCTYPESLRDGTKPGRCGMTPGAWYPLGRTEYVPWPQWESAEIVVAGPDLEQRTGETWDGSKWTMLADPLPDDGTWHLLGQSAEFGVLAKHDEPPNEGERWRAALYRSKGGVWEEYVSGLYADYDDNGSNVQLLGWVRGWPLTFSVEYSSEDVSRYWSIGRPGGAPQLPYLPNIEAIDMNSRGDVLTANWKDLGEGEFSITFSSLSAAHVDLPVLPYQEGLRAFVDESGVPYLGWPTSDALEIRKLASGRWQVVPSSDKGLDSLPPEWRFDVRRNEYDGKRTAQTLLRVWRNCAWQGLSASDRGGGVSSSDTPADPTGFSVTNDRVCVEYVTHDAPHLRCHSL